MLRTALAAALLLGTPLWAGSAQAQRFDSGWRRIAAASLPDLDLSGGDVRPNNLIVAPERDAAARQQPDQLATYLFTLSVVKRAPGPRNVYVQLIGVTPEQVPTVTSIIAVNFSDGDTNRLRTDNHRFPAVPKEVASASDYFVLVMVQ